jgi:DNA helicase IV
VSAGTDDDAIATEQSYVSMLYGHLDELREQAATRLAAVLKEGTTGGTMQARSERDAVASRFSDQVARYAGVEGGLCFGRLDFDDGGRSYVGRIGLFDEASDYEPLLLDWRAPAARPFYLATAASPEGVRRRRHIRTRGRSVVSLDDEVLDVAAAHEAGLTHDELTGESALLGALTASRTGRMQDIVATIQVEQDRIIRSDPSGVLVVQGGPGTGKTAVALHRAAYLLYTYRQQLETRGVLIVGPNATFLRYISQVLPSLAETGVLLCTLGDLFPGVRARRYEPAATAAVKGRAEMADVLTAAVAAHQRVPDEPIEVVVDQHALVLDRWTCIEVRNRARRSGRQHNLARPLFAQYLLEALTERMAERIGTDPYADDPLGGDDAPGDAMLLGAADLADIRRELEEEPAVQAILDDLWPILTPRRVLADLYADPALLEEAASGLLPAERARLQRSRAGGWTPADVPLLDELAELLGEDASAARARLEALRRARIEYAEGALEVFEGSRPLDVEDEEEPEILLATDLLDASALAERHAEEEHLTTAQRAAADRQWAFGHVIVDEAQELSPMAWRLLMRRSPNRSMTLVGDVAQTGDLAGTSSWDQVLRPYVADRWHLEELTVNYRTPAEVMAVASAVLAGIDASLVPPRSVRQTGIPPRTERLGPDLARVGEVVKAEAGEVGEGRVGVIVPELRLDEVAGAVTTQVPDTALGEDPELTRTVVVLTVRQAKGLEFDSVVVVDPSGIIDESPRGQSDLYVALTRATQRLTILHDRALPPALR